LHDDVSEQIDSFCSSSQELGNQITVSFFITVATSSSFLTVLLVFSKSEADGTNAKHGFQALVCKKCQYPLKETKDISVSVRQHKFGRQVHQFVP
jgi:hypothetical protein